MAFPQLEQHFRQPDEVYAPVEVALSAGINVERCSDTTHPHRSQWQIYQIAQVVLFQAFLQMRLYQLQCDCCMPKTFETPLDNH